MRQDVKQQASDLFIKYMDAIDRALGGDDSVAPAVLKVAQEFFKENSITVDNLNIVSFDDLATTIPLDEFEDDLGATAH